MDVPGVAGGVVPHRSPIPASFSVSSPEGDKPGAIIIAAADDAGSPPCSRSEAIVATAEADAYASRHPRCPQAQRRPFGPGSTICAAAAAAAGTAFKANQQ